MARDWVFLCVDFSDDPCEKTYCAFGATCFAEGGRGACKCPESCSSAYSPVCSTDGMTHLNECLFRKFVCQHQKATRIRHSGECGKSPLGFSSTLVPIHLQPHPSFLASNEKLAFLSSSKRIRDHRILHSTNQNQQESLPNWSLSTDDSVRSLSL